MRAGSAERVASVAQIWRYPVKSLGGECLKRAEVGPLGVALDRQYVVVDSLAERAGRWLTARQVPGLLRFTAFTRGPQVCVETPEHVQFEIEDPGLLRRLEDEAGRALSIVSLHGAHFDDSPLSLLNLASLTALESELGRSLDARRFRMNVWLAGLDAEVESGWLGSSVEVGSVTGGPVMTVTKGCGRCVMVTMDPDTTVTEPEVLRHLVSGRGGRFGIYCGVRTGGTVAVGDKVTVCAR